MFNITNTKTFKDSVHGYIDVPRCLVENLMDNEYFQRLRNVEQTGMRVLYPNAKHDRFSHSLGVFHLGQRAVDALLDNFSKDQYWNIESDNQSILYWAKNKVLFLIACLLHDIGHAPFSHTLESQLLKNSKAPKTSKINEKDGDYITSELQKIISENEMKYMEYKYNESDEIKLNVSKSAPHEQIGALLIFNDFFRKQIISIFDSLNQAEFPKPEGESILYSEYYQNKIVIDKIDETDKNSMIIFGDDLCFIARMIMGIKYDDWRPERQIRNCFIELLNGTNFDVDKLDYIVRDTQMSGINNISLDVDRLVNSLCIITKTKHFNKLDLGQKKLPEMTIVNIKNSDKNNELHIDGNFQGTLIIKKGTEVAIERDSKINSFTNIFDGEVKIKYKTSRIAHFDFDAIVTQDSEPINGIPSGDENRSKVKVLRGKNGKTPFSTSIMNAIVLETFNFIACEDIKLNIRENCKMTIKGIFNSERPIRLFSADELKGDISEIEILGDTFKHNYTNVKVPSENGYNTFTIGFKKQAINVIANVMDARNYLYLWIYAHHKVIYYANFLIPVLAKELLPDNTTKKFPDLSLDFKNIKYLDDTYIWAAIKYEYCNRKWKSIKKDKELYVLVEELFTRKYKRSLYKSLAEYDLFFEKYDQYTKNKLKEYINSKLIDCSATANPYIGINDKMDKPKFSVGYFKKAQINIINGKLTEIIKNKFEKTGIPKEYQDLEITEFIYVSADYKRKQFKTLSAFIDMNDDIVPISQIPLLDSQIKKNITNDSTPYFYLYYQTNNSDVVHKGESEFIKQAAREYFGDLVETKIKK